MSIKIDENVNINDILLNFDKIDDNDISTLLAIINNSKNELDKNMIWEYYNLMDMYIKEYNLTLELKKLNYYVEKMKNIDENNITLKNVIKMDINKIDINTIKKYNCDISLDLPINDNDLKLIQTDFKNNISLYEVDNINNIMNIIFILEKYNNIKNYNIYKFCCNKLLKVYKNKTIDYNNINKYINKLIEFNNFINNFEFHDGPVLFKTTLKIKIVNILKNVCIKIFDEISEYVIKNNLNYDDIIDLFKPLTIIEIKLNNLDINIIKNNLNNIKLNFNGNLTDDLNNFINDFINYIKFLKRIDNNINKKYKEKYENNDKTITLFYNNEYIDNIKTNGIEFKDFKKYQEDDEYLNKFTPIINNLFEILKDSKISINIDYLKDIEKNGIKIDKCKIYYNILKGYNEYKDLKIDINNINEYKTEINKSIYLSKLIKDDINKLDFTKIETFEKFNYLYEYYNICHKLRPLTDKIKKITNKPSNFMKYFVTLIGNINVNNYLHTYRTLEKNIKILEDVNGYIKSINNSLKSISEKGYKFQINDLNDYIKDMKEKYILDDDSYVKIFQNINKKFNEIKLMFNNLRYNLKDKNLITYLKNLETTGLEIKKLDEYINEIKKYKIKGTP